MHRIAASSLCPFCPLWTTAVLEDEACKGNQRYREGQQKDVVTSRDQMGKKNKITSGWPKRRQKVDGSWQVNLAGSRLLDDRYGKREEKPRD